MDVEKRLAADAEILARQVEGIDTETYLEEILATVDALDAPHPASEDAVGLAGFRSSQASAPPRFGRSKPDRDPHLDAALWFSI